MSAEKQKQPRTDRFTSEPSDFAICSGPNRGKVLGDTPSTKLRPGQKQLVDSPEPPPSPDASSTPDRTND